MATFRGEREPVTDDDDEDDAVRLRVALRWASVYEFCCRNPDVDSWSNDEPPPPGTYRGLADYWLSEVSAIVGYRVDDEEAGRLWRTLQTSNRQRTAR